MRSLGSVESAADLPFDGCQEGDFCYVRNIEHHWMWDGRIWQDLGTTQDLEVEIKRLKAENKALKEQRERTV